ncbi:MAG: aminopeptidase P family protein [Erysipelotrichaceae bacterium]
MIKERIKQLRKYMEERNMDAYIIPTSDFHETEYAGEYFKARKYMSGFSGSAGTLVVAKDKAALWSDGRYFIQAEAQLKGTGIDLMKMGEPNVPTMNQYLNEVIDKNGVLGFDGRVINARLGRQLSKLMNLKAGTISCDEDLVDLIWKDRPALPKEKAFLFDVKYCGKSANDKLVELRAAMKLRNCDTHIINTLDDIAWLFNLRGHDIDCFPVVLAYAIITSDEANLYVDQSKLDETIKKAFNEIKVTIKDYNMFYEDVKTIDETHHILVDTNMINYAIYNNIQHKDKLCDQENPTQLMKACKNQIEIENDIQAHIKDGVAVTKFMYWLKTNVGKINITEMSAADQLLSLRKAQSDFIEPSFDTISAYKEHAAMMHYSADEESNVELKREGMLLVDSGGQYLQGTTDITRTFALGELDDELKFHFTTVLRSLINLAKATFLSGIRGTSLDILARGPLWDLGIDYRCGTGHGIGFLLNVHEAPNGFRWRVVADRNDSCVLQEGMITTDEPGVYIEGSHGIRSENELVVRDKETNEYGQFLQFETITYVPFDLDAIDPSLMNQAEIDWLNAYHKTVFKIISPYLDKEEVIWLKQYTRAI